MTSTRQCDHEKKITTFDKTFGLEKHISNGAFVEYLHHIGNNCYLHHYGRVLSKIPMTDPDIQQYVIELQCGGRINGALGSFLKTIK